MPPPHAQLGVQEPLWHVPPGHALPLVALPQVPDPLQTLHVPQEVPELS